MVGFWGVSAVTGWSAFGAFELSRSGPLLRRFSCHGLVRFLVHLSCHGLVRFWAVWYAFGAFELSRAWDV